MRRAAGIRQCVSCRTFERQQNLFRICKTGDRILIDPVPHSDGRSAYICRNQNCVDRAKKKGLLQKSLFCQIPPEVFDQLKEELLET